MIDFGVLTKPFKPNEIEWRIGSTTADKTRGLALAYMDARAVMNRLDEVCGAVNWQCRYSHADSKTVCEIGIRITTLEWAPLPEAVENTRTTYIQNHEWIWKADGAGDTNFEAEKGALSDAFKRAAGRWGIGRYLYDLEAKWVSIEKRGSSYVITQGALEGLRNSLAGEKTGDPVGELTSGLAKSKLAEAVRNLLGDLEYCTDQTEFEGILEDNMHIYIQCKRDFPKWFYGDPNNQDAVGLENRINEARKNLIEREPMKGMVE